MSKGIPRHYIDFDEMTNKELDQLLIICKSHLKALKNRQKKHALSIAQLSVPKFLEDEIGSAKTEIEIRSNPLYRVG